MWETDRHEKKLRGGVFSKKYLGGSEEASERAAKWKYNSARDPKKKLPTSFESNKTDIGTSHIIVLRIEFKMFNIIDNYELESLS